jgi:phage-related protein
VATVDDVILRATLRQEVTRGLDEIVAQLQLLNRTQAAAQRQSRQTARGLDNVGDQAKQAARRITSMTASVLGLNAAMRGARGLAGGIGGASAQVKLLVGVFSTLIPAAVPVAATLTASFLSLGSVMATVTASVGVLALGFSGIGDAVSALASGDMDKINEAFANLAPAGQAFARALFDLKPVLDTLRGTAQQALLPGVQVALQTLATLLPVINPLVAVLGQSLGLAAQQVANFATSPGFTTFLQFITDNAGQIQTITGQFLDLTQGVLDLTIAFGPLTNTTLAGIGGMIDAFGQFASGASGTLGAFLGYVEEAMPHVNDFFSTFGTVLIQLLTSLAGPGLVVLDALTGILDVIGGLAPTIGALAQVIGVGLLGVVGALTPIIAQLGPILGDVLVTAATALAGALVALAPTIGTIAAFIGQQLLSAVQVLAPYLPTLGAAFLGVFTALEPLLPLAVSLIPVIGDSLLVIFQTLTPVIAQLVSGVGPLIQGVGALLVALTPLIPVLGDALLQILAAIIPQLPSLVDGFLQVVNALIPLVPQMIGLSLAVLPLLQPMTELVTSLLPLLAVTLSAVVPLVTLMATTLSAVLTPVIDVVSKSIEGLVYLVEKLVGYLNNLDIGGKVSDLVSKVPSFGEAFHAAFGDTASPHGSGNLASTLGSHTSVMGAIGSGVGISNALIGGGGHGRGSGDHQAGRALDIVGPRMGAYAAAARAQGHYAALHGSGAGRHAHVAFRRPMGDTGTSMAPAAVASSSVGFGGETVVIQINAPVYGVDNLNQVIYAAVDEKNRLAQARRKN